MHELVQIVEKLPDLDNGDLMPFIGLLCTVGSALLLFGPIALAEIFFKDRNDKS